MDLIVYSKNGCAKCVFTKKFLDSKNVEFTEKNIDKNKTYLEEVKKLGYNSLPVVKINNEKTFSGYDPNKLQSLVTEWQK